MAGRPLEGLALQGGLEHVFHFGSLRDLPPPPPFPPPPPVLCLTSACPSLSPPSQLRMWEEVSVMVPITAALLRKFDLHVLLEANKTLSGTAHDTPHTLHRTHA